MREVLFQQSQFELLPGANTELDRIVSMLEKYPAMELMIEVIRTIRAIGNRI